MRYGPNLATVEINVIRNVQPPVFLYTPYATEIDYNIAVGTEVYTVAAREKDPFPFNAIIYELMGDDEAPDLFNIDMILRCGRTIEKSPQYSSIVYIYQAKLLTQHGILLYFINLIRNSDKIFTDSF